MEDNFYLDDFELSLKEQANQFKMIPSKKVWHGIYNDMHPGRRWPSVTVSLLLITSIVFVGYINTHHDKKVAESQAQAPAKKDKGDESNAASVNRLAQAFENAKANKNDVNVNNAKQLNNTAFTSFVNSKNDPKISTERTNILGNINHQYNSSAGTALSENMKNKPLAGVLKHDDINTADQIPNSSFANINKEIRKIEDVNLVNDDVFNTSLLLENGIIEKTNSAIIFPLGIISQNKIIPNSALTNEINNNNVESPVSISSSVSTQKPQAKNRRKKNSKITWVYFTGLFANSVAFNGNHLNQNINQNSLSLPQVTQKDIRIIHNATLGFEAGIQMNYLVAKKLQFTVGTHFTRSGYNITSNEVHPILTSLLLKDKSTGKIYSRDFVTHFGDGTGKSTITLHNYNYQASIPLGFQYALWGNNKIQFNLAADIEPSFVLKSNAYLLSTDGRNYVNIPDLYRTWNLNSNFGPFITFKSDKFKWNIGPTIRYQWLSSYTEDYTIKEHLIDYGIRIGISK